MGEFIVDFIPLIPFPYILPMGGEQSHFYFIKIMRLLKTFKLFNIHQIMGKIMHINKKKIEYMIKHDDRIAEETNVDINKISTLLMVNFVIRIIKIALLILTTCYFLGLAWYIFCDLVRN